MFDLNTLRGSVRPVITLTLTFVLSFLVIAGRPLPEAFLTILSMVLGYWFAQRSARSTPGEN